MEILLWLVPPLVVTLLAMAWVGWVGRSGRGEVGREEAARRIGAALEREHRGLRADTSSARTSAASDPAPRSTGVAVRRPTDRRPDRLPRPADPPADRPATPGDQTRRRAS